jgi:hypothetical protein
LKRLNFAAFAFVSLIAACSGGGTSTNIVPQTVTATVGSQANTGVLSEAQSDAELKPQQLSAQSSADLLYVGNVGNNSITVYHHDAQGNAAPLHVIVGSKTGISNPGQLSEDAQGNLYVVSSGTGAASPSILVFAHGADGNIAPIRTLAGPLTGFHSVRAMTVDSSTGKIFVVDDTGGDGYPASLLRFAPNATGNEAPFARGSITFWAYELASDSSGQNIIEAHITGCCSVSNAGVDTFAKQFANNTAPANPFSIRYFSSYGVADDPTTKTYLVTSGPGGAYATGGIYRLAETTTGAGPLAYPNPATWATAPVSIITSDTCGTQLALGYQRNIYVTHSTATFPACPTDAVYVYAHDASGNASPLRVLSGGATKLAQPYGIFEGQ